MDKGGVIRKKGKSGTVTLFGTTGVRGLGESKGEAG